MIKVITPYRLTPFTEGQKSLGPSLVLQSDYEALVVERDRLRGEVGEFAITESRLKGTISGFDLERDRLQKTIEEAQWLLVVSVPNLRFFDTDEDIQKWANRRTAWLNEQIAIGKALEASRG
jgi:hypothetical protein